METSSDSESDHPDERAKRLDEMFDGCILEVTSGRIVYSTQRIEHLLCKRGWDPEDARRWVAHIATSDTSAWSPDYL